MANALDWVARSSWLSADVTYGVLQTGDSVVITLTLDAAALVAGLHTTDIVIENNDPGHVGFVIPLKLEIVPIEIGDVNADGAVNAADLIYLVQAIFHGAPEPPAWVADFNCDFSMTVADVVAMVNYIFKGAPAAECE